MTPKAVNTPGSADEQGKCTRGIRNFFWSTEEEQRWKGQQSAAASDGVNGAPSRGHKHQADNFGQRHAGAG